jgi:hypothetical protein
VDFVDLQRRRKKRARVRQKPETPRRSLAREPFLLPGTGFVVGALSPNIFYYMFYPEDPALLSATIAAVTAALACYAGWLLLKRTPVKTGPKLGSEKQLLMAIQAAGGITPVEAALETSLTVDEVEEILTRFADRGHLTGPTPGAL